MVMLEKWLLRRFSSPGNSFSKFWARYRMRCETSMMSSSLSPDFSISLYITSLLSSCTFFSYSRAFRATYSAPAACRDGVFPEFWICRSYIVIFAKYTDSFSSVCLFASSGLQRASFGIALNAYLHSELIPRTSLRYAFKKQRLVGIWIK